MDEYIKRDAVHDVVSKLKRLAWQSSTTSPNAESCVAAELDAVHASVERIPAADVRPVVKGTWHGSGDGYADGFLVINEWECPFCGKYFPEWDEKPDWNFCPNCGADMREES